MKKLHAVLLILLGLALTPLACSGDELQDHRPKPPGTGGFDPGPGGLTGSGSGAYGAGASSPGTGTGGSEEPGPPVCDDELKRCEYVFTYTDNGETSVEVRGTFAPDGWMNGVPMQKNGAVWSASIEVPWNGEIQYKFVLNGNTWIEDPVNPIKVNDNNGGYNSVLKDVM